MLKAGGVFRRARFQRPIPGRFGSWPEWIGIVRTEELGSAGKSTRTNGFWFPSSQSEKRRKWRLKLSRYRIGFAVVFLELVSHRLNRTGQIVSFTVQQPRKRRRMLQSCCACSVKFKHKRVLFPLIVRARSQVDFNLFYTYKKKCDRYRFVRASTQENKHSHSLRIDSHVCDPRWFNLSLLGSATSTRRFRLTLFRLDE